MVETIKQFNFENEEELENDEDAFNIPLEESGFDNQDEENADFNDNVNGYHRKNSSINSMNLPAREQINIRVIVRVRPLLKEELLQGKRQ